MTTFRPVDWLTAAVDTLAGQGLPVAEARLEARVLLASALGVDHAWLLAHGQDFCPCAEDWQRAQDWLARRALGEPVAYILGWREFYGLRLTVSPAVLIPRPDTEVLVDAALELLPSSQVGNLLDLGTGSGAIALAIAAQRPQLRVLGVDASPQALAQASQNAYQLGLNRVVWMSGNWWQAVGDRRFDMVVSNPPYIAESDPHLLQGDLRFEPRQALAAANNGLADLAAITAGAPEHLVAGGWLLLEHGYGQGSAVRMLMAQAGLTEIHTRPDLAGHDRVTCGRYPAGVIDGRCRTGQSAD